MANSNSDVALRSLAQQDQELLARATFESIDRDSGRIVYEDVWTNPRYRHYFDPWPVSSDFGFVATDESGEAIGVVSMRFFTEEDPSYGFIAEDIPELMIWVSADKRGRGVGTLLVDAATRAASERQLSGLSLFVEEDNPAQSLYRRSGFVPVDDSNPKSPWLKRLES